MDNQWVEILKELINRPHRKKAEEFLFEEYKNYAATLDAIYNERNRSTRFYAAIASSPIILQLVNIYQKEGGGILSGVLTNKLLFYLTFGLTVVVTAIGIALFIQYIWNRFNYQEKLWHMDTIALYFKRGKEFESLLSVPQKERKRVYFTMRADFWLGFIYIIPNSFYLTVLQISILLQFWSWERGESFTKVLAGLPDGGFPFISISFAWFVFWVLVHIILKWRMLISKEVGLSKRYGRVEG